jgi:hypothetical protein
MLEYTDINRQQLIVRQSSMDRAVQILIDRGFFRDKETDGKKALEAVKNLTDQLEKIIRNA